LQTLAFPPAILTAADGVRAQIRPYDGPDAQSVIQTVNARHNSNPSRSHNNRANSISVFPNGAPGGRSNSFSSATPPSLSASNSFRNGGGHAHPPIPEFPTQLQQQQQPPSREQPSPTLPSLPSHPTLNSLISSSLGEAVANPTGHIPQDPAILATSLNGAPPRIGDPGKRMLGHALGVRHPGLPPRQVNGGGSPPDHQQGMKDVQRAMSGLVVAE
jgi:hypothetical protein